MKSAEEDDLEEERSWVLEAQHDIEGFRPLYEKYHDEIFRFIYRRVENQTTTLELTSEVFYKALRNIKKYRWQGKPFVSWLYAIALNEIRKRHRNQQLVFLIEDDKVEEAIEYEIQDEQLLRRVFARLTDNDLQLVEWKYFEGKTFKELAALMSLSESAVKMKLYRLLEKLKQELKP